MPLKDQLSRDDWEARGGGNLGPFSSHRGAPVGICSSDQFQVSGSGNSRFSQPSWDLLHPGRSQTTSKAQYNLRAWGSEGLGKDASPHSHWGRGRRRRVPVGGGPGAQRWRRGSRATLGGRLRRPGVSANTQLVLQMPRRVPVSKGEAEAREKRRYVSGCCSPPGLSSSLYFQ